MVRDPIQSGENVVFSNDLQMGKQTDTGTFAIHRVVEDVTDRIGTADFRGGLDRLSDPVETASRPHQKIPEEIGRTCHAPLNADPAERPLETIVGTADILLTSIEFDVVIVAENHPVAVDIGVAIETAIRMKVSGAFDRIVPAVIVTADNIVVTQHGRCRLVDHQTAGPRRMRISPGIRSRPRIVNIAALHHGSMTAADENAGVIVHRLAVFQIEFAIFVKALYTESSPAGNVAVDNTHETALPNLNGILSSAAQGQTIQQNIRGILHTQKRFGLR